MRAASWRWSRRLLHRIRGAWPAATAFALALTGPLSALQAKTDCASLDIGLNASSEFTTVECDRGSFLGGGPSQTEEVISAGNSAAVFYIHHAAAGNRTYFTRGDTQSMVRRAFAKMEGWTMAPGGAGFAVARFRGWLTEHPSLSLACFAFARFSGHVDRTSGYSHVIFGFYCADQPGDVSDADTRRFMGMLKYDF